MIYRDVCKKLKFYFINKYYKQKAESVLEKETHEIVWDFEIQMNRLISDRIPDLLIIKKRQSVVYCTFSSQQTTK